MAFVATFVWFLRRQGVGLVALGLYFLAIGLTEKK